MDNDGKPLPKTPAMTLHEQWVRCGKPTCRCATGQLHGPYTYLFWRDGGRQHKRYIRPGDLDDARAAITDQRARRHEQRALHARYGQVWRDLRDQLKEVEQWKTTEE